MAARLTTTRRQPRNFLRTLRLATGVQMVCRSIFVGHHHGDGGFGFVHVERVALGNQLHELGAVIVVADIQGNRHAGAVVFVLGGQEVQYNVTGK